MTPDRNSSILYSIIARYIDTAEPVGSKVLSDERRLKASPATIRNVMAELEEEGLIEKRHCSAGRVPTIKGFRLYIDNLLTAESRMDKASREAALSINDALGEIKPSEDLMHGAAHLLSTLTRCTAVAIAPKKEFTIKHIKLIPLSSDSVMLVAVSDTDETFSRVGKIDKGFKPDYIKMTNYLNMLGSGLTLISLRKKILREMKEDKNKYDKLLSKTLELSSQALSEVDHSLAQELILDGTANIFDAPEFSKDAEKMKKLYKAFEEKNQILKILEKKADKDATSVLMGIESDEHDFDDLSFITSPCVSNLRIGTLGVVGPVRMDYSRIIPIVRYTAMILSK